MTYVYETRYYNIFDLSQQIKTLTNLQPASKRQTHTKQEKQASSPSLLKLTVTITKAQLGKLF